MESIKYFGLIFCIFLASKLDEVTGKNCPALSINHGKVSYSDGLKVGSKAKYTCDKGFELFGSKKRTCKSTGKWSGTDATCIDLAALEKMVNDNKKDIARLKTSVFGKYVFSAVMSVSLWDIQAGAVVPFDTVQTNIGGGFSTATHKYTCPISGYYFFSATVTFDYSTNAVASGQGNGPSCEVTMKIGSKRVFDIIYGGHPVTNDPFGSGSHSVVHFCKRGQKVFLEADNDKEKYYLLGNSEGHHSCFMGFLLCREDDIPPVVLPHVPQ